MVAVDHKLKPSFFLCDSFVLISIISDTLLLVSLTRDASASGDHDVIEIVGDTLASTSARRELLKQDVETGNPRIVGFKMFVHMFTYTVRVSEGDW